MVDLGNPFDNKVVGYIPTAYFPTSIAYDAASKQLVVADDKGVGANTIPGSAEGVPTSAGAFNTHYEAGRVSLIPLPNARKLAQYTEQVIDNNRWSSFNPNIAVGPEFIDRYARPVPVPKHIGEPSLIKHVFLIIRSSAICRKARAVRASPFSRPARRTSTRSSSASRFSTMSTPRAGNRRTDIRGSRRRDRFILTTSCRPTGSAAIRVATAMTL